MTRREAAGARGEGLEPSITGPEPVVLPITPPPNGGAVPITEQPNAGVRPAGGPGPRRSGRARWRDAVARGGSRESTGFGGPRHAWVVASGEVALAGTVGGFAVLAFPAQAGAAGLVVKVYTRRGACARPDGDRQRPRPPEVPQGQPADLVRHRVHRRRPGSDQPRHGHPPLRHLRTPAPYGSAPPARSAPGTASRRASPGTAMARTDGPPTCVIGVGDIQGQGTVVRITFKAPPGDWADRLRPVQASCSHSRWL